MLGDRRTRGRGPSQEESHIPPAGVTQTMTNPFGQSMPLSTWTSISSTPLRITAQVTAKLFWGSALKGKRDKVVIATKFGHIVNEQEKTVYGDAAQIIKNVRTDVENSLRRLQTDFIDIYQLHEGGYDPKLALELQSVLEDLVADRKDPLVWLEHRRR